MPYIFLLTLVPICFRSFSEEAGELIQTLLENEDKSRTASEMGDLLYHAMVLLSVKDVKMEEVLEILRKRFSQSDVEEKASRKKS
jgi:pyruvate kinase/phosphoribosyl-ATP pyrophosphohydrolase/phosphoribosyl-AMP cyclohydrolase